MGACIARMRAESGIGALAATGNGCGPLREAGVLRDEDIYPALVLEGLREAWAIGANACAASK